MRFYRHKYGFTLVELLIVIIVVAVLATIAIPKFANSSQRAKEAALRDTLAIIRSAGERCEQDTGAVVEMPDLISKVAPTEGKRHGQMGSLWADVPIDPATWNGPYLEKIPINPITGTAIYNSGIVVTPTVDWTFNPAQSYNPNHYLFPSKKLALDGTQYQTW
jgi:prepilin-type N-terminal cleavage/methylation domain-containing protein